MNVYCTYDKLVPLAELKPHPRNPNRHPEHQLDLLAKVLIADGWRHPITVSERSGYIIAGHGRLKAAKRAGLVEAPVDFQPFESEAAELSALVADNRLAELAERSLEGVKSIFDDLQSIGCDIELTGFDLSEIDAFSSSFMGEKEKNEPVYKPTFKILVYCEDEGTQEALLQKFILEGIQCQALML